MNKQRRVPGWLVPVVDGVRGQRERMKSFLRSLAWRSRCSSLQVRYIYRSLLRHTPAHRSVIFLHNSYYHFYYLAKALRKRGWDAITVSLEDPRGVNSIYYHGEDLNLFSDHPAKFAHTLSQLDYNMKEFFAHAKNRFRLLHFAGDGLMSFFPGNWGWRNDDPWDILEWKAQGNKVAYTISGCNSGVAQSSVMWWSSIGEGEVVCNKCVWQLHPEVCNDVKNLEWGRKVQKHCDVIFTEAGPALDAQAGWKCVREPTTTCLDPMFWRPDLEVPSKFRIGRGAAEMLVYHAMGNYALRTGNGRNIKGTPAVLRAIGRLQKEGVPVRLVFVTGRKNTEARFLQVQCDVIVDQLNYGRYGATAREGMMLGKPTVCYINRNELSPEDTLLSLSEVPLVSATERSIYEVLKDLLLRPEKREAIGKASRAYALKWHSMEACADRYEQVYDRLMKGVVGEYKQSKEKGTP